MRIGHRPGKNGQTLVELALLLPVLLLLSVVTIDLGRAVYYYSVIYNVARETARIAIVNQQPYNTEVVNEGYIVTEASEKAIGLNPSGLTIDIRDAIISDTIKVDVDYCFNLVTPIAQQFIHSNCRNGGFKLNTSSTMTIER